MRNTQLLLQNKKTLLLRIRQLLILSTNYLDNPSVFLTYFVAFLIRKLISLSASCLIHQLSCNLQASYLFCHLPNKITTCNLHQLLNPPTASVFYQLFVLFARYLMRQLLLSSANYLSYPQPNVSKASGIFEIDYIRHSKLLYRIRFLWTLFFPMHAFFAKLSPFITGGLDTYENKKLELNFRLRQEIIARKE